MVSSVSIRKGDRIRSILTEKVYRVRTIKDWAVVLRSLDGLTEVWTERGNLSLFYEKLEDDITPKHLTSSPAPEKLPRPAYGAIEIL